MHNTITIARLALLVFFNVGALVVLAWMHYVHGDAPAGVAMALGLGAAGWITGPELGDVARLINDLQEANKHNTS